MVEPLIRVQNLKKYFPIKSGLLQRVTGQVKAVDDVSFDIWEGETFGLVGESGCGKTTIGKTLLRGFDPTEGDIYFNPPGEGKTYNIAEMRIKELRKLRKYLQMIFQDPYSSLNPRMSVRDIIVEPLVVSRGRDKVSSKELDNITSDLLKEVGLNPKYMKRYPHAFSGGQRQRIGIARALVLNPSFIVGDEPVSALDVSVQAQILELLLRLKDEYELSYLFIAHDLSVVKYISDRVGVMYVGNLAELADTDDLYGSPLHPYTEALLQAIPKINPDIRIEDTQILGGEVADPSSPPSGCYFHPRCRYAEDKCEKDKPEFRNVKGEDESPHYVACHFAGELDLTPAYEVKKE